MRLFVLGGLVLFSFEVFGFSRCKISFDASRSKIEGTGYKFTEKAGVTASFPKFTVSEAHGSSLSGLLDDLVVTVDLLSVDSKNAARDQNLRNSLFMGLTDESRVKVVVKDVSGSKLKTQMTLNGVTRDVDFQWTENNGMLIAEGRIDILDFSMNPAFTALQKLCNKLHVGKDGKSKTWSDFALKVSATLVRDGCDG